MENLEFERLKYIAKIYFGGMGKLSDKLGLKRQTLYVYKNRRSFGRSMLDKFRSVGINTEYIRTGKGTMLLKDKEIIEDNNKSEQERINKIIEDYKKEIERLKSELEVYIAENNKLKGKIEGLKEMMALLQDKTFHRYKG